MRTLLSYSPTDSTVARISTHRCGGCIAQRLKEESDYFDYKETIRSVYNLPLCTIL